MLALSGVVANSAWHVGAKCSTVPRSPNANQSGQQLEIYNALHFHTVSNEKSNKGIYWLSDGSKVHDLRDGYAYTARIVYCSLVRSKSSDFRVEVVFKIADFDKHGNNRTDTSLVSVLPGKWGDWRGWRGCEIVAMKASVSLKP